MTKIRSFVAQHPRLGWTCALLIAASVALMAQQPIANLPATATADGSKVGLDVNLIGAAGDALGGTLDVNITGVNGATPLDAASSATLQSAATANGNGSTLSVNGYGFVVFTVNCSVSCSGGTTVNLEGTEDGTNYAALARAQRIDNGTYGSAILNQSNAAATIWGAPVGGLQAVRARISGYSAGTITVTARAVSGAPPWYFGGDPCATEAKTTDPISLTADTVIVAAASGKKNYICALNVVAGAAEIVSITEGTGSTCATNEAALAGSTTDANGMSFAANGGIAANASNATLIAGKTTNVDTCLNVSGTNRVAGFVTWVQR